jgi:uncharacterized protein (TIGR02588 family)
VRRNWLEWAILVASVVSIVVLAGYLGLRSLSGDGPAEVAIEARYAEARVTLVGWEVPVTIRNDGGSPATTVTLEATAMVAGKEQTSEIVLDLLAPGVETEVVVGFSAKPAGEVTFRLVGYEAP